MIRAAILESSKEKREYALAGLDNSELSITTKVFSNRYDFLESLDSEATSYDILIISTTLVNDGDGVEIAKKIRNLNRLVMICFISDSEKYYADAFSVFATGYFLYPFDVGKLHNCINFFFHKTKVERRASLMIKQIGERYRRIYCRNILYIESSNHNIILHMENGSMILTYGKLSQIEKQLPQNIFFRCHQSYIVSLYFVDELSKGQFIIKENNIPISRKYLKSSKNVYLDYLSKKRG